MHEMFVYLAEAMVRTPAVCTGGLSGRTQRVPVMDLTAHVQYLELSCVDQGTHSL